MMRKRRLMGIFLSLMLVLGMIPAHSFAAEDEKYETVVAQLPGYDFTFAYNDGWFAESSFTYNPHISTLSALASMETGTADSMRSTLQAMGFEDVEGNGYYGLSNDKPESIAVMAGKKMIRENGEEIPLIGIVVRGYGYNLEWYGNFLIGDGGIHEDFKTTRDEAIRFINSYAKKESITGKAKIWITGHSRGGAVANLVAGYYAMNTDAAVNGFTTSPENVYGYPVGTPDTVVAGTITKGELLSVSAARTDAEYAEDTPGEALIYAEADKDSLIDPADPAFSGIHYLTPDEDLITKLPPKSWNYTVLGTMEEKAYITDQDALLYYLELLYGQEQAEAYKKYGGPANYKWMTFDLDSLSLVEDTSVTEPVSQSLVFDQRTEDLAISVGDPTTYETSYQAVLASAAGLFSTLQGKLIEELTADQTVLIKTGVLTYIAYVKQWYKEKENKNLTDGEAAEIVAAAAITMLRGEEIDPNNFTIDDLLYHLCRYFADNTEKQEDPEDPSTVRYIHKTKLAETLHTTLAKVVNSFGDGDEEGLVSAMNMVYSMLRSGAYGTDGSKETVQGKDDGKAQRTNILMLIGAGVGSDYPAIYEVIQNNGGEGRVSALMDAALPIVKEIKQADNTSKVYDTAEEAADALISMLLRTALDRVFASGKVPSTGYVADQLRSFTETLATNPDKIRRVVTGTLLGADSDTFDIPTQIRTAATFIGQAGAMLQTHLPFTYAAWMLSQDDLYPIIQNKAKEGEYEEPLDVELTATEDAVMYYTLDGSDPTETSTKYTGPITLEQTDETREITLKVIGVRNGKAGQVWEYNYTVEAPVTYRVEKGDGSEWKKGSPEGITFTVKRSCHDEKTIDQFDSLLVDGVKVDESAYGKKAGSVILTLSPEFLETLDTGEHVLAVVFADADPAEASFKVLEKEQQEPEESTEENTEEQESTGDNEGGDSGNTGGNDKKSQNAKTGDDTPIVPLGILMSISLLAMGGIMVYKRKRKD